MTASATTLLALEAVTVRFGGLLALREVSLSLPDTAGITAIIGPNGAGKTTLFNVISGLVGPSEGKVLLHGRDISHDRPDSIFRAGLARTFQGVRLFANLTLQQNILLAATSATSAPRASPRLWPFVGHGRKAALRTSEAALSLVGLDRTLWQRFPSELSSVQARLAEIARALAGQPAALLLDEPGAGLNPAEKLHLCEQLRTIVMACRCRIVLVEHDMKLVMSVAETVWVMNFGTILRHGTPRQVQADPAVIEAYLGAPADDA